MSADLTTVSKLLEEDRLRMKLAEETGGRLLAERQNMNYQISQLAARAKKHAEEKAALADTIGKKYGLKMGDEIDIEAGDITRAPLTTPPELPTAGPGPTPHLSLAAMPRELAADHNPVVDTTPPNGATAPS